MVSSRTATAVAGLILSIIVSLLLWWYFNSFVFFLFVPFVPFLFRRAQKEENASTMWCPSCGFETRDQEYTYCPRDGTRLEQR